MLNKFFTKPVELKIGDQNYKFCSVADFEFSLPGRTYVPSRKITDMVQFSTDQLRKEAKTIKDIEKRDNKTIQITDMSPPRQPYPETLSG